MRAIVMEQYGGKEVLQEAEVNTPVPGKNQVLVKEYATSVNPVDWKVRKGYMRKTVIWEFPIILGWDVAGVVAEVGEEVTDFKVGDAVFARPQTTRFGTYAEYTLVDSNLLAKKPTEISFEAAAAIPLAGLTAWQALFDHAKLQPGERVLIHGGAGGVGSLAIQFAKQAGAYVITTASKRSFKLVKSLGADEVIDYITTEFAHQVSDIDVVLDTIGGEVQRKSIQVLREGTGRLISIVGVSHEWYAHKRGIQTKAVWMEPDGNELQQIAELLTARTIRPVVGKILPFSKKGLYEAHALSEAHHANGKIVIKISE